MNQHIGFSRFCYNFALSLYSQLDHKEYPGGASKKVDLIRKIFTRSLKPDPEYAWTRKMSSRVYQNAFRALKMALSRFFKGLGKYPKFKKKKHPGSFTVDSSNGVILIEGGKKIKLPTLGTFRTKEIIPKCVAQTYTVSKRGDKYYVAFAINAELVPPITHEVVEPVGIDLNLTDGKYCMVSDGTTVAYPKPLKAAKTELRQLQYRNRHKQLGNRNQGICPSNNARKYYRQVAKLQQKIANQRLDFLQKLTTDLARKYRHLRVETLNLKGLMQNHKLAFHFADASFYKFKTLLQHKAVTYGGIVESVATFYPSSKLCSRCGNKKEQLELFERVYRCSNANCPPICRDLNSAINLKNTPLDKIVARVGSTRSNVCGHDTADGRGRSKK